MGLIQDVGAYFDEPGNAVFRGSPVDDAVIDAGQKQLGVVFDSDYVEFLKAFGGSFVGIPVYGFSNSRMLEDLTVVEITERFRSDGWPVLESSYVFSMDMQGNPIIQGADGTVSTYDHDAGEIRGLANSFAELILSVL